MALSVDISLDVKTTFRALSVHKWRKGVFIVFSLSFFLCIDFLHAQPKTAPSQSKSEEEIAAIKRLEQSISTDINNPRFSNSFIGMEIKSVKSGESLFHQNENRNFLPASNLKLVTSAAALGLLGTDYRYTTVLVSDGTIRKGVLKGNLIIRGSGDPTFGSPSMFPDKDPT